MLEKCFFADYLKVNQQFYTFAQQQMIVLLLLVSLVYKYLDHASNNLEVVPSDHLQSNYFCLLFSEN
jgi:hypothetical protein